MICYFKWEFLRRNSGYQKDYEEFAKFSKEAGWDPNSKSLQLEHWGKPENQRRLKYGVAFMENPNKEIPLDKIKKNPFWPFFENKGLEGPPWPSFYNPLYPKNEPVILTGGISYKHLTKGTLTLTINLTYPQSEIVARVKKFIRDAIREQKKYKITIPKPRPRKRFNVYQNYLRAWDLRQQGKTFKEIAQENYPKEFATAPDVAIKMARTHVKEADRLIREGYGQIR